MKTLRETYQGQIPALARALGISNVMAVPKVQKAVVNVGVGRIRDEKQLEAIRRAVALITGQKAAPRPAKKAIAAFKTRKGLIVGYQVTLRGRRMWDFLTRLVWVALPRQRDFRGLEPTSVDGRGNLTIGIREHIVFPEMIGEDIPFIFGLEVSIATTARNREQGLSLFKSLGFPMKI